MNSHHKAPEIDGRAQRTVRSRKKIIEACFALNRDGVLVPTAQEVADRSGLGIRTVFRHFSEMESLYVEADKILGERYAEETHLKPEGSIDSRLTQLVTERTRVFESYSPYLRSTIVQKWRYTQLSKQYLRLCKDLRKQLLYFIPEVTDKEDALIEAANAALSFEVWDKLRTVDGRSKKAIREIMLTSLRALVQN